MKEGSSESTRASFFSTSWSGTTIMIQMTKGMLNVEY